MKSIGILLACSISTLTATQMVWADSNEDNAKWVAQCITDNKDEGQKIEVITSYCNCMNDKMPSNESQSISEWEKTHKTEDEACSKAANWLNKDD